LGSTGSIGVQALEVAKQHGFKVAALAAGRSGYELESQIRAFKPAIAALEDEQAARLLRIAVGDTFTKVLSGPQGVCEIAQAPTDILLNAIVGIAGLRPTLTALTSGKKRIALANKETLVTGGELVMRTAKDSGASVIPVDSEHSAVFQCLLAAPPDQKIKKIILTASGGPFFRKGRQELETVTLAQTLKHPNWNMGAKITVDSATMMNKGLEIIEAVRLFDLPQEQIDVVIHRESIIHSMVEFCDHSVLAQMGTPDMRVPIQFALTFPDRAPSLSPSLDLTKIGNLSFYPPDDQTFPAMNLCRESLKAGGLKPTALNAANEEAVRLFLEEKIRFTDIFTLLEEALDDQPALPAESIEAIFEADSVARRKVNEKI